MANLRWGLIGCGDIAQRRVAPALRDAAGSELLAVARARFELAGEFARQFAIPRAYKTWQELLADPEIDAVYIATPVDLHAPQTIAASEAGKHVLCEKPMALSAAECDRMIAACRANSVQLGIAYYRRFYPVIERARTLITQGEIGQVVLAQMNAFSRFDLPPENPRSWLFDKQRAGGGPMMAVGCHRLEIFVNLFGSAEAEGAFAGRIFFQRPVEDTGGAFLRLGGGARGVLLVTQAAPSGADSLDIWGSAGSLHIAELNGGRLKVKTAADEREERHAPHANLHQPLIEDFVLAVAENRPPRVTGETGREVSRLLDRIYGLATEPRASASGGR
jgi:predicted dehydrogenase